MKILILNGSPRMNGNTHTALNAVREGLCENRPNDTIEWIDVCKHKLSGCINCDGCKKNGGDCVLPDESAALIRKVDAADILLIGSPVYWWGISSQLKMLVDKFYSRDEAFHHQKKRLGLITVGAGELSDPQYGLIQKQFECICDFLGWSFLFNESFAAWKAGEVKENSAEMDKLSGLWRLIR